MREESTELFLLSMHILSYLAFFSLLQDVQFSSVPTFHKAMPWLDTPLINNSSLLLSLSIYTVHQWRATSTSHNYPPPSKSRSLLLYFGTSKLSLCLLSLCLEYPTTFLILIMFSFFFFHFPPYLHICTEGNQGI